jgi:hypothetical protein
MTLRSCGNVRREKEMEPILFRRHRDQHPNPTGDLISRRQPVAPCLQPALLDRLRGRTREPSPRRTASRAPHSGLPLDGSTQTEDTSVDV